MEISGEVDLLGRPGTMPVTPFSIAGTTSSFSFVLPNPISAQIRRPKLPISSYTTSGKEIADPLLPIHS